jgi:hypothetical protein
MHVRSFLENGDARALVAPPLHIPYPDPGRLATLLSDPTVRRILPPPLSETTAGPLSRLAHGWQRSLQDRWVFLPPGHPAGVRVVALPVLTGEAIPFQVADGIELELEVEAPDAGPLLSVGVFIGTYARRLDGALTLRACASGGCVDAASMLAPALDNQDLVLVFDRPLAIEPGERLTVSIGASGTRHPVAIWLLPAPGDATPLRVQGPEGSRDPVPGRRPRLALGFGK